MLLDSGKKGTNRKRVSTALQKVLDRTEGQTAKERKKAVNEAARKLAGVKKKGPLDHIDGLPGKSECSKPLWQR